MSQKEPAETKQFSPRTAGLASFLGILCVILGILFLRSFAPAWVVFANDGPLGAMMAERTQVPATFMGEWADLNSYGSRGTGAFPSPTFIFFWLVGPLGFAKFYAPFTLLFLGVGAWFFLRQLDLGWLAAMLGGLGAALCADFFGVSCWGVGSQSLCFGLNYLALAVVVSPQPLRPWVRYPLAGLAVGMGVMEAFDIGAIFSVFTAVFVFFHALVAEGNLAKRVAQGGLRVVTLAAFAGFIAAAALTTLIGTQVKGVVGMAQDAETKAQRWDQATQWSLPKREALGILIPGLFGFRMDTPDGGNYWGAVGRDPAWDRYFASGKQGPPPGGFIRYGGGGGYASVPVVLISLWALLQSFRRQGSVFSDAQRKLIWFWAAVAFLSLLMAFGRFGLFGKYPYGLFYALPFASTIRNPAKFLHVWQWSLLVIFAYGVSGLSRRYLEVPATAVRDLVSQVQSWWARAAAFDRKWTLGSLMALGAGLLGWLIYASSKERLVNYLKEVQFDETAASAMAAFSSGQVGSFVLFLAFTIGLFTLILSGYFSGRRARIGAVLLGLLLLVDLGWSDRRWVVTYNWKVRYESNPVIEFLRTRPYEQRVAIFPLSQFVDFRRLPRELMPVVQQYAFFAQLYGIEWTQHLFQYYNIQSLDIIQEPRVAQDKAAYEAVLAFAPPLRRWELSNTRYLLGPSAFVESLNQQLDAGRNRFRIATRFDLAAKTGVDQTTPQSEQLTTVISTNGQLAVIDFTGALPRAKLYTNWKVSSTNDPVVIQDWAKAIQQRLPPDMASALAAQNLADLATLRELVDKDFDPSLMVLLAEPLSVTSGTNHNPGEVKFESYAPKHIVLSAKADAPCVLLLNDKFDPNWKVTVDGQPARLLRCNFIMRGVFLDKAGGHRVEFKFEPPLKGLHISLAAIAVALGLLAYVGFAKRAD